MDWGKNASISNHGRQDFHTWRIGSTQSSYALPLIWLFIGQKPSLVNIKINGKKEKKERKSNSKKKLQKNSNKGSSKEGKCKTKWKTFKNKTIKIEGIK